MTTTTNLIEQLWASDAACELTNRAARALEAQAKLSEIEAQEPRYISIECVGGFLGKLEQGPQPVLYTDSINECMVRRDDVWLALTSQLKQAAPLAPAQPVNELVEALEYVLDTHFCTGNDGDDARARAHKALANAKAAQPLTKEQVQPAQGERSKRDAFEAYAKGFDTFGDKWQDRGIDEHFIAGYEAALLQSNAERVQAVALNIEEKLDIARRAGKAFYQGKNLSEQLEMAISAAINGTIEALAQAQPAERMPLSEEQCRAKFEQWYASAQDADEEPERTYELTDESMTELTKECIWIGWQAAHNITKGQQ